MIIKPSDCYETPPELYDPLHEEFGFTIDACAEPYNAKCPNYILSQREPLLLNWRAVGRMARGREQRAVIWCNPPYSNIEPWLMKACIESAKGAVVVVLCSADTSTIWWHEWALEADEIRFLRGRVEFIPPPELKDKPHAGAKRPSALLIYRPRFVPGPARIVWWDWKTSGGAT